MGSYLKDLRGYEVLDREAEMALGRRLENGDECALDELVASNLRFVVTVAKQYQGQGLELEDLVQSGNLGLMEAARRYDYRQGRFLTMAYPYVMSAIVHAIHKEGTVVRRPSQVVRGQRRAAVLRAKMEQELERAVTKNDAVELDETLAEAMFGGVTSVSLDETLGAGEDACKRSDFLACDERLWPNGGDDAKDAATKVDGLLGGLSDRDRKVMEMLYGIGTAEEWTVGQVALVMGLTEERIRQIRKESLRRMQAAGMRECC